jgi:thiamine kinase-like enzyme
MKMTPQESDDHEALDHIIAAAEKLLSSALGGKVHLGDITNLTKEGGRNQLLRCRNLSGGEPSSFIIKRIGPGSYNPEDTASLDVQRFFSDWAGAQFLSLIPGAPRHGPGFYGGERGLGFFILEDLGPHHSLIEPLQKADAVVAERALLNFAARLGKVHADSIGKAAIFERLLLTLSPNALPFAQTITELYEGAKQLRASLDRLEVHNEPGLPQELANVVRGLQRPGPFLAYIHGDLCPDNIFYTGDQSRLIDFESGRFSHAMIDAACGRMMFPTCWCANRLPRDLVSRMESTYRAELVKGCREAQEDRIFETGLVRACGFWLLINLIWYLEGALKEDQTWGNATMRSRLLARLEAFTTASEAFNQLPAARGTASRLLEVLLIRWPGAEPLAPYPAFG